MDSRTVAHGLALFTVFVWGLTFISTKNLLEHFSPVEILLMRFAIGIVALYPLCPHILHVRNRREELDFALAGLFGICLYYLLENIALSYTYATNVGVIVAVVPFFTAILSRIVFGKEEKLGRWFFPGFAISMFGVAIVSFSGGEAGFDIKGDLLALLAGLMWAIYSIILRRIAVRGYNTMQITRRTFLYGFVFMLPAAWAMGFDPDWGALLQPSVMQDLLFLGLIASAVCYVTWGFSLTRLGAVSASLYIYLIPVITAIASALLLGEPLTYLTAIGVAFTLAGLILSQKGTGLSDDQERS